MIAETSSISPGMTKDALTVELTHCHQQLTELVLSLNEEDFRFAPTGKWNAGQQLDHIVRSAGAVTMALGLPRIVLRLLFGKSNRPSRTFDALVTKYKSKLASGGKAKGRFIPRMVEVSARNKLANKLKRKIEVLGRRVDNMKDSDLDLYILPHPLLGKLTIREMIYFTIFHADHHRNLVLQNLSSR